MLARQFDENFAPAIQLEYDKKKQMLVRDVLTDEIRPQFQSPGSVLEHIARFPVDYRRGLGESLLDLVVAGCPDWINDHVPTATDEFVDALCGSWAVAKTTIMEETWPSYLLHGRVLERMVRRRPDGAGFLLEKIPDVVRHHLLGASEGFVAAVAKANPEFLREFANDEYVFVPRNGKVRRVSIESGVKMSPEIVRVQQELAKVKPEVMLEPADRLHVTLGYFGFPDALFGLIKGVVPSLTRKDLKAAFQKLLGRTDASMPGALPVLGTELVQFDSGAIVIKLDRKPIAWAQRRIYEDVIGMLRALDVENPEGFVSGNAELMYLDPDKFQPHVTIAKVDSSATAAPGGETSVPGVMPSPISVDLTPSYVANARIIPDEIKTKVKQALLSIGEDSMVDK